MRKTLILSLALPFLLCAASRAASSPEGLWTSDAQFRKSLQKADPMPGDPADPAVLLKRTKNALDRCYRLDMDYKMLASTLGEAKAELDKFAAAPQPSVRDRIENLVKFLADAQPVEGDRMEATRNDIDFLYYDLPSKPGAELAKAVKDFDAYVGRITASVTTFSADSAKLQARAAELEPTLGGRAPWLAAKLSEDAAKGVKFMEYVKARLDKVAARLDAKR